MKLYIAGSSQDLPRVKELMTRFQDAGYTLTHDWTTYFDEVPKDYTHFARLDLVGIQAAEYIIFLYERDLPYRGTHTELGLAISWRKPCLILGEYAHKNIFTRLENMYFFKKEEEILEYLYMLENYPEKETTT